MGFPTPLTGPIRCTDALRTVDHGVRAIALVAPAHPTARVVRRRGIGDAGLGGPLLFVQAATASAASNPWSLRMFFAVRFQRGGPWDWSRDLREQEGSEEHAHFMNSLVREGFIVLGGPLEGGSEILHAVNAPSEQAVRRRLAEDNWAQNGVLTITSVEEHISGQVGRQ